jgi:hypothetical protein
MTPTYYLILVLNIYQTGGGVSTFPLPFQDAAACRAAGKQWESSGAYSREYVCLQVLSATPPPPPVLPKPTLTKEQQEYQDKARKQQLLLQARQEKERARKDGRPYGDPSKSVIEK